MTNVNSPRFFNPSFNQLQPHINTSSLSLDLPTQEEAALVPLNSFEQQQFQNSSDFMSGSLSTSSYFIDPSSPYADDIDQQERDVSLEEISRAKSNNKRKIGRSKNQQKDEIERIFNIVVNIIKEVGLLHEKKGKMQVPWITVSRHYNQGLKAGEKPFSFTQLQTLLKGRMSKFLETTTITKKAIRDLNKINFDLSTEELEKRIILIARGLKLPETGFLPWKSITKEYQEKYFSEITDRINLQAIIQAKLVKSIPRIKKVFLNFEEVSKKIDLAKKRKRKRTKGKIPLQKKQPKAVRTLSSSSSNSSFFASSSSSSSSSSFSTSSNTNLSSSPNLSNLSDLDFLSSSGSSSSFMRAIYYPSFSPHLTTPSPSTPSTSASETDPNTELFSNFLEENFGFKQSELPSFDKPELENDSDINFFDDVEFDPSLLINENFSTSSIYSSTSSSSLSSSSSSSSTFLSTPIQSLTSFSTASTNSNDPESDLFLLPPILDEPIEGGAPTKIQTSQETDELDKLFEQIIEIAKQEELFSEESFKWGVAAHIYNKTVRSPSKKISKQDLKLKLESRLEAYLKKINDKNQNPSIENDKSKERSKDDLPLSSIPHTPLGLSVMTPARDNCIDLTDKN